jgi:hypothetical protein
VSFTARYDSGTCYECGLPIREGDTLAFDEDDDLYHLDCLREEKGWGHVSQPALFDLQVAQRELRQP